MANTAKVPTAKLRYPEHASVISKAFAELADTGWDWLPDYQKNVVELALTKPSLAGTLEPILTRKRHFIPHELLAIYFLPEGDRIRNYLNLTIAQAAKSIASQNTDTPTLRKMLNHGLTDPVLQAHYPIYAEMLQRFIKPPSKEWKDALREKVLFADPHNNMEKLEETLNERIDEIRGTLTELGQELAQRYIQLQAKQKAVTRG